MMTCEEYKRYHANKKYREKYAAMTPEEKEQYLADVRAYYKEYKKRPGVADRIRANNRAWWHRSGGNEKRKKWLEAHPGRAAEWARKRKESYTPEELRMADKRYRDAHRAKMAQQAAEWPDAVREDIKEWRKRHHMTQKQLAEKLAVGSGRAVSAIETGAEPPTDELLDLIGISWRPNCFMGPYQRRYGNGIDKLSICNCCDRTDCDWHRLLVPVEGWKARIDYIRVDKGGPHREMTWHVEKCPLYHEPKRPLY